MATLVREAAITAMPDLRFRLDVPIRVSVFLDPDGIFRAAAPDLGMWTDGVGSSEAEAIEDLSEIILAQRESIADEVGFPLSEYAKTAQFMLENQILEA